jgi:hypothetical protein
MFGIACWTGWTELEHAMRAAYEASAAAARVPLHSRLIDPFTTDETLWEFENLFVLSGQTKGECLIVSARLLALRIASQMSLLPK